MSWPSRVVRIDPDAAEYVWVQIARDLRSDIESGEIPDGTRLPSGPELAEIYGVSRGTVIKAVDALREDGLVRVLTGRGTFVTKTTRR
jgi:DNA-binding GntR family transcriptional regulator